jgi:hypothetical protein
LSLLSGPAEHPPGRQSSSVRLRERIVVAVAVGVVFVSVVVALRDLPPSRPRADDVAAGALTPDKIPLVTGDEPIIEMFTRSGCPVCHIIPGIPGANGRVGPPLILGTTGEQRLNDPGYKGQAKTVHDYVVESVLEPQRFVVRGYPEHTMPVWYGSKLSAMALEKIAVYLERQTAGDSAP